LEIASFTPPGGTPPPDAIRRLMQYMLEERIALFEYFEKEGLLDWNTDNQMSGPRSYGRGSASEST